MHYTIHEHVNTEEAEHALDRDTIQVSMMHGAIECGIIVVAGLVPPNKVTLLQVGLRWRAT